jgi:hypothetical protein
MRLAAAVAIAACSAPPEATTPAVRATAEPTGPELVVKAPGANAFAVDGDAIYWLAPGGGVWREAAGSAAKLADVDANAHGIAIDVAGASKRIVWVDGAGGLAAVRPDDGSIGVMAHAMGEVGAIAAAPGGFDYAHRAPDGWRVAKFYDEHPSPAVLDGDDPVIAIGSDVVVGTSTTLYQGSAATPVDGGVRALAVDGDDVFVGNTAIFEKAGRGALVKLGPAGGPVTAMAVDPIYIYWAIAAGEREPAIYRARRARPELELFTKVGSATQLIVAGEYLYWLDPVEGAIHRIKRQPEIKNTGTSREQR